MNGLYKFFRSISETKEQFHLRMKVERAKRDKPSERINEILSKWKIEIDEDKRKTNKIRNCTSNELHKETEQIIAELREGVNNNL